MSQEFDHIVWVRCHAEVPVVVKAKDEAHARELIAQAEKDGGWDGTRTLNDWIQFDGPNDEPEERTVVPYHQYFNLPEPVTGASPH